MSDAEGLEPEFPSSDFAFMPGTAEPLRVVDNDGLALADFEMIVENGQVTEGRVGTCIIV